MKVGEIFERMQGRLIGLMTEDEIRAKASIAEEILRLKVERRAVVLAHNYMDPALFNSPVPDFHGDSLDLSRRAAETDRDVIVFCGVGFMAETAKILSPSKTVLLPVEQAGCSLAESIKPEQVRELRRRFPNVPVVTYINTYAEVKAESDLCCTSGNAVAVVNSLKADQIIFLPDRYLAANIARRTGRHIIFPTAVPAVPDGLLDYQMVGWAGTCEVHEKFTAEEVASVRRRYPGVVVLSHLECPPDVVEASDYAGSTKGMIQYVEDHPEKTYFVATECAMVDNIAAAFPRAKLVNAFRRRCPHMEKITLEHVRDALKLNRYVIEVPEEIRVRARLAVERMLAIG